MSDKKRMLLLVLIMAFACLIVTGTTIAILYRTAFDEQRNILATIADNHARMVEDIAQSEAGSNPDHSEATEEYLLAKITHSHKHFERIGHTGEFVLAKREGSDMVFLLDSRFKDFKKPVVVPMASNFAEPMRRALLGYSGTIEALDYRGIEVLAAYEPIHGLNWGIVAKVDVDELRNPFIHAGLIALNIAAVVVLVGVLLFRQITGPIIKQLEEHSQYLVKLVGDLQESEENLKRIRDELETRVEERTAKLADANKQLEAEVMVRTRAEERLRALWTTAEMANADEKDLCDHILQGTLQMTHSKYAFYGLLNPEESAMNIYAWSKEAQEDCLMDSRPIEYPVAGAGLWAEAIRQRKVIVVNDYQLDNQGKKGLPCGHVQITRFVAVPVLGHGRIVAVVVAANKDKDYDSEDVKQLEAFASGVQIIIDQRKVEEALRKSEKECRLLSREVIDAQEKERKRLAREIHDGIGQSLAALKYRAEGNARAAGSEASGGSQELNSFIQMIRDAMEEVRKIQNDLRPAYLDMMGVLETMSDFCEKFQATYTDIRPSLKIDISEQEIPDSLKATIFRIFQEAMNNAAKHSVAKRILVSIQRDKDQIELAIRDDGIGFNLADGLSANGQRKGLGLFSMKERAELSGGSLEFKSAPGEGTTIIASWQLSTDRPIQEKDTSEDSDS